MSDTEFRLRELERRMGKVEDATAAVPVMQRDIAEIKTDVIEGRDETRSLRRSYYTLAASIAGGSVLFAISVFELFK